MNGHSALILYVGLAGVTGLSLIGGANQNWVIIILLALNGLLVWAGVRSIGRICDDVAGITKTIIAMEVVVLGKDGVGGLQREINDPKYGLVKGQEELNQAVAFLLTQGSQVIRAVSEANSYDDARNRLRPFLTSSQGQIAELRDRIEEQTLAPSGFVRAD